jgi:hypothetical protein
MFLYIATPTQWEGVCGWGWGGILLIRHVSVDHLTVYGGGSLPSGRWGASLTFPFEFGSKEQPSGLGKRPLRLVFGTFFLSFLSCFWVLCILGGQLQGWLVIDSRHSFSGTLIVKYIFTPGISSRLSQFLVILRHDFVLGMAILTCEVNLSQALGENAC